MHRSVLIVEHLEVDPAEFGAQARASDDVCDVEHGAVGEHRESVLDACHVVDTSSAGVREIGRFTRAIGAHCAPLASVALCARSVCSC